MGKKKNKGLLKARMSNVPSQSFFKEENPSPETVLINVDDTAENISPLTSDENTTQEEGFAAKFKARKNNTNYSEFQPDDLSSELPEIKTEVDFEKDQFPVSDNFNQSEENHTQSLTEINTFMLPDIKRKKQSLSFKQILSVVGHWFTVKRVIISLIVLFALLIAVGQIPSLLYKVVPASWHEEKNKTNITINSESVSIANEVLSLSPEEDWDADGYVNGVDENPYNPDVDFNGVLDGVDESNVQIITNETVVQYRNVELLVTNMNAGVTYFQNQYHFTSYIGWVKFSNVNGIPYCYDNYNWKQAESVEEEDNIYVYIKGDCRIEFLETASAPVTEIMMFGKTFAYSNVKNDVATNVGFMKKPIDIFFSIFFPQKSESTWDIGNRTETTVYHKEKANTPIVAPSVLGTYNLTSYERFKSADNSVVKLSGAYNLIDQEHTVLCSLQGEQGEALCIVYGYDYLGNLYVADYNTQQPVGIIQISIKSQTMASTDGQMLRDWYEFEGLGFSSQKGDRLVFIHSK